MQIILILVSIASIVMGSLMYWTFGFKYWRYFKVWYTRVVFAALRKNRSLNANKSFFTNVLPPSYAELHFYTENFKSVTDYLMEISF